MFNDAYKEIEKSTGKEFLPNMYHIFDYLFGSIDKYELRRAIDNPELVKDMWRLTLNSGYVMKNCKLFAYATRARTVSHTAFGVLADDVDFLKTAYRGKTKWRTWSLKEFDMLESNIFGSREFQSWVRKFIYKKLTFLRSWGVDQDELYGELIYASLCALRKSYPRYENELHALNGCKAAAHNAGIGLIHFYTRKKRQRFDSNGESNHEQLNDNMVIEDDHRDFVNSVLSAIETITPSLPTNEAEFISAAACIYNEGLSTFLLADNTNPQNYKKYLKLAREYFSVTLDKQEDIFRKVKEATL